MELDQLRYFVKVAELGSFTRAAEELIVSQPTISQQIINLERELGQLLLERLSRKVRLTDAGHLLFERAREILDLVEDTRSRVVHFDESGQGRVCLAAIPTIAPYLLPEILKAFVKRFPQAQIDVEEDVTENLIRACQMGDIDVGILALPLEADQLHIEPLFEEELFAVMSPGHRLAKKKQVTLDDLSEETFILLHEAHCLSEQVISFCRREQFQPISTSKTTQLSTVQEMVALDHGISLIPAMARKLDQSKRRAYRSFSGEQPTRTIAMIWSTHRFQARLAQELIALIREHYQPKAARSSKKQG